MRQGQSGVEFDGVVEQRAASIEAIVMNKEIAAQGEDFCWRNRAGRSLLVGAEFRVLVFDVVEIGLVGIDVESVLEFFQVTKSLACRLNLVVGLVPSFEEMEQKLLLASIGIEHEVMDEGPGFSIKDRGAVGFVVIRGIVINGQKGFDGEKPVGMQDVEVRGLTSPMLDSLSPRIALPRYSAMPSSSQGREMGEVEMK